MDFKISVLKTRQKFTFFPPLNIWGTSLRYLSHTSDKYYPVAFSHGCKLLFPCCSTTYRRFMLIHIIPDGPCSFLALKERGKRCLGRGVAAPKLWHVLSSAGRVDGPGRKTHVKWDYDGAHEHLPPFPQLLLYLLVASQKSHGAWSKGLLPVRPQGTNYRVGSVHLAQHCAKDSAQTSSALPTAPRGPQGLGREGKRVSGPAAGSSPARSVGGGRESERGPARERRLGTVPGTQ